MRLCPLTLNQNDDAEVFVNPAQVIDVRKHGTVTAIATTASAGDRVYVVMVKESLTQVVLKLDEALRVD